MEDQESSIARTMETNITKHVLILYTVIRVHARVYEQGVHYVWHMHYKVIRMLHLIMAIHTK